jgi:TATA-box binding protein (TBP) (component of TFIID and TFIIIB)
MQLKYKYTNVACKFTVDCRLDLKKIAERQNNLWLFRDSLHFLQRKPHANAIFRQNGGASVYGMFPQDEAEKICRRFARIVQRTGFNCHFRRFAITNMAISTKVPFKLTESLYSDLMGLNASNGIIVRKCESKPGIFIEITKQ